MLQRVLGSALLAGFLSVSGLAAQEASEGPAVLEVTARDYELQSPVTRIPSGWTTVELTNEGEETHVLEFVRLPENGSYRALRRYAGVLDTLQKELNAGTIDSTEYEKALKRHQPSWFPSLEFAGGPGFVAPGQSFEETLALEPGSYMMLCFVRDSTGKSHLLRGMRRKLVVTEDSSGATPPEADVEMRVTDYRITTEGEMSVGEQTVAIRFGARPDTTGAPTQSVHLARVDEGLTPTEIAEWDLHAPAPTEFLGGALEREGETVYLTVNLAPGRYAWLSGDTEETGMKKVFTVGEAGASQR